MAVLAQSLLGGFSLDAGRAAAVGRVDGSCRLHFQGGAVLWLSAGKHGSLLAVGKRP